ncbi:MAG: hypothetical protein LC099_11270 [Anaerolineales bacterium]|nr:hypothetical protein [Anaerolineales bacterium]
MRKRITLVVLTILSACAAPPPTTESASPPPALTATQALTSTPNVLAAATPTTLVSVSQAACHLTADSGAWCFALVQNNAGDILENVSAQINLLDKNKNLVASQNAFPLLDAIPANSSAAVYAFFPNAPADAEAQVQILSATTGNAANYLSAVLDSTLAQIDESGKIAYLSGRVYLSAESNAATQIWIAATAYDENGTVVGLRRWEGGALSPGSSLNFQFNVSSVGAEIAAVDFAIQAR